MRRLAISHSSLLRKTGSSHLLIRKFLAFLEMYSKDSFVAISKEAINPSLCCLNRLLDQKALKCRQITSETVDNIVSIYLQ